MHRIRAQCIVVRGNKILMVRHNHQNGQSWWCLPGGGVEPGETPAQAALRELHEECGLHGTIVRKTAYLLQASHDESITFLIDAGDQTIRLGTDPEFPASYQILVDARWLALREIPERDRAYLWESGLLSVADFKSEVGAWGDQTSYPD